MIKSTRYDLNEVRFLARRCNALIKEKDLIMARNDGVSMDQWPDLDLVTLRDVAIEMAGIRARQAEQLKIIAADAMIAMLRKGASAP